jgi:hypothetical protein
MAPKVIKTKEMKRVSRHHFSVWKVGKKVNILFFENVVFEKNLPVLDLRF